MNFGQAFTFPFQDQDWAKKILIMAGISLLPILGQVIVLGWVLEIARRFIRRDAALLPDLDINNQLIDGLKSLLAGFAYGLPVLLIELPIIIVGALSPSDDPTGGTLFTVISVCCGALVVLYAIALGLVLPAVYANIAYHGTLAAAFNFSEVFGLVRAAPGAYLLALAGSLLGMFIVPLGLIACFVGVYITGTYFNAVLGSLYGQAYREAKENQGYL